MNPILGELRKELALKGDAAIQQSTQRFFKESVVCYGLKSATVEGIAKNYFIQLKAWPKTDVYGLCEQLWQSGYMEECMIACEWSYAVRKQYTANDMAVFERWIQHYVTNWATCDTLCNHTVGTLVEMFPPLIDTLKTWSRSPNRWMKRASAVSLIIPARQGLFLDDIFEIADTLLSDPDDMVQKGYGWMLKSASKPYQQRVFDYVVSHKATMPRTALRYAIEKMPKELKAVAKAKG